MINGVRVIAFFPSLYIYILLELTCSTWQVCELLKGTSAGHNLEWDLQTFWLQGVLGFSLGRSSNKSGQKYVDTHKNLTAALSSVVLLQF